MNENAQLEYPIARLIALTNMFFCGEWWYKEECVSRQGHISLIEEWSLSGVTGQTSTSA